MFARRLDDCSSINVVEARSGDFLAPGRALICPGNRHFKSPAPSTGRHRGARGPGTG